MKVEHGKVKRLLGDSVASFSSSIHGHDGDASYHFCENHPEQDKEVHIIEVNVSKSMIDDPCFDATAFVAEEAARRIKFGQHRKIDRSEPTRMLKAVEARALSEFSAVVLSRDKYPLTKVGYDTLRVDLNNAIDDIIKVLEE